MNRGPAKSFEDLVVWQRAHAFVLGVYGITRGFPNQESFGLVSQLRRAAVSIAANIAEGFKKRGKRDKIRFLNISQGSVEECRYYLILSRDLQYTKVESLMAKLIEVSKLLEAYSSAIRSSTSGF